jgi:intein/homing endonuclease
MRVGRTQLKSSKEKISKTMKLGKIDNFARYRADILASRPESYFVIKESAQLAELLGVVLGDGYIGAHARTDVLRIACNLNNPGFIMRYSKFVESIFDKQPSVKKRLTSNCVDIVIYQKGIAERLGLETGAKTHRPFVLPEWIKSNPEYQIKFLRGLFETDGCHATHLPTYTYKFMFTNVNLQF